MTTLQPVRANHFLAWRLPAIAVLVILLTAFTTRNSLAQTPNPYITPNAQVNQLISILQKLGFTLEEPTTTTEAGSEVWKLVGTSSPALAAGITQTSVILTIFPSVASAQPYVEERFRTLQGLSFIYPTQALTIGEDMPAYIAVSNSIEPRSLPPDQGFYPVGAASGVYACKNVVVHVSHFTASSFHYNDPALPDPNDVYRRLSIESIPGTSQKMQDVGNTLTTSINPDGRSACDSTGFEITSLRPTFTQGDDFFLRGKLLEPKAGVAIEIEVNGPQGTYGTPKVQIHMKNPPLVTSDEQGGFSWESFFIADASLGTWSVTVKLKKDGKTYRDVRSFEVVKLAVTEAQVKTNIQTIIDRWSAEPSILTGVDHEIVRALLSKEIKEPLGPLVNFRAFAGNEDFDPFTCGALANATLNFLDKIRFSSDRSTRLLMAGVDYGPLTDGSGWVHIAVALYPHSTDKSGWLAGQVLEPWFMQKKEVWTASHWRSRFTGGGRADRFWASNQWPGRYPTSGSNGGYFPTTGNVTANVDITSRTQVLTYSPVEDLLVDAQGRRIGRLPDGTLVNEIPDADHSHGVKEDGTFVNYFLVPNGRYEVTITGVGDGVFHLMTAAGNVLLSYGEQQIVIGQSATFSLDSSDLQQPLTLPDGSQIQPVAETVSSGGQTGTEEGTQTPITPTVTMPPTGASMVVNGVADDAENRLARDLFANCTNDRVAYGEEGSDGNRCFTFRYPVPEEGIKSAFLHIALKPALDPNSDAILLALGELIENNCLVWGAGEMAGCIVLTGIEPQATLLDIDLFDLAGIASPQLDPTVEEQEAVIAQLHTGILHGLLQDEAALYCVQLVINSSGDELLCDQANPTRGGTENGIATLPSTPVPDVATTTPTAEIATATPTVPPATSIPATPTATATPPADTVTPLPVTSTSTPVPQDSTATPTSVFGTVTPTAIPVSPTPTKEVGKYHLCGDWYAEGSLPGCVALRYTLSGEPLIDYDLFDLASETTIEATAEGQQAVIDQLYTGVVHILLQDDTIVYCAQLVLNGGDGTPLCDADDPGEAEVQSASGLVINATDDDPDNQMWNCQSRAGFGEGFFDVSRCFTFRYDVPQEGITEATLHIAVQVLEGSTEAIVMGLTGITEGNDGGEESGELAFAYAPIMSKSSSTCLDIEDPQGTGMDPGSSLVLWGCMESESQYWEVIPIDTDTFILFNDYTGLCLDIERRSRRNGASAIQQACSGEMSSSSQLWQFVSIAEGYYAIKSLHSGKCLDLAEPSGEPGTLIELWDCNNEDSQQWLLLME